MPERAGTPGFSAHEQRRALHSLDAAGYEDDQEPPVHRR
jgi:hypothetical protein